MSQSFNTTEQESDFSNAFDFFLSIYNLKKNFCSMRGLNPRQPAHKTGTLPTELMLHYIPYKPLN
jgi:hypothetical protein